MISKAKMIVAETVLNMVINDERAESINGYVEAFENCREQGYKIVFSGKDFNSKTVAFSENRNSDDIVVYNSDQYEMLGCYSDCFWNNRKYFSYNDFIGASNYIVELMIKKISE